MTETVSTLPVREVMTKEPLAVSREMTIGALAIAVGLGPAMAFGLRVVALALVAVWLTRAVRRPSPMAAAS